MGFTQEDFARALAKRMREAASLGDDHDDVNAGELHREVGGYSGPNHRMPTRCTAMRAVHAGRRCGTHRVAKG